MKKILFFFLFVPILANSQKNSFNLNGKADFNDSKEIFFSSVRNDTAYLEYDLPISVFNAKDTTFQIRGIVSYPIPVWFSYARFDSNLNRTLVTTSHFFFIEKGQLQIQLKDNPNENIIETEILSNTNVEYEKIEKMLSSCQKWTGITWLSQNDSLFAKRKILKQYVIENPNSYVAMWLIILDYIDNGYSKSIEEITNNFSLTLKTSKAFKALTKKMLYEKSTLLNQRFPIEIFNFKIDLTNEIKHSKYLLIDFWASYCHPCLDQIPKLKRIYEKYNQKGFGLYSISIDNKNASNRMLKIIAENEIHWKNSIDFSGINALKINVSAIPKNYLINTDGKVVAIDLTMTELENYLEKNIIE
jgi:thiol-disulfide isomerase/thioredoxin